MAFSMRWKLLMATAATLTLAFGACGDEEKKEADNGGNAGGTGDGGAGGGGLGGGLGDLFDGGVESLLADLDDDVAGSPCTVDTDCKGKNATCAVGAAEVRHCTGLCTNDSHCGAGGKCVQIANFGEDAVSLCNKVWTSDDQCDSDLQCRKGIDVSEIIGGVAELLDGGIEGLNAQETPKICQEKANTVRLPNGVVGKACTADTAATACGGGTCETLLNPGGYCSGNCLADSDCGNTGGCARDIGSAALGLTGSCRLKCTEDSDCREDEGYTCQEAPLLFGEGSYCAATLQLDGGFPFPFGDAGTGGDAGSAAPAGDSGT